MSRTAESPTPSAGLPDDDRGFASASRNSSQFFGQPVDRPSPMSWALRWAAAPGDPIGARQECPPSAAAWQRLEPRGWDGREPGPRAIKIWWRTDCAANIGIVTAVSPKSSILVIDIDAKPSGPQAGGRSST